jgi:hypothetical protein
MLKLDPQQRRQKTLETLTAQLMALAQGKPVLMIFEDVHGPQRRNAGRL